MKKLPYILLDVFTTIPFGGNPLAVFYQEDVLNTETMQRIAKELNLSETVFIQPASSSLYQKRFRIFTPEMELPIAGHPTVGASFALADKQLIETTAGQNNWTIEENVGAIPVTIFKEAETITKVEMVQPIPTFLDCYPSPEHLASLLSLSVEELDLSIPAQSVSAGVPFLYIPVKSLAAIKKIQFQTSVWSEYFKGHPNYQHIFAFTMETETEDATVHSRMFAPAMGISEDPATGAASGPLGAYLVKNQLVPPTAEQTYAIKSEQGFEIGRPSFIDIIVKTKNDGEGAAFEHVSISGSCVTMGTGEIYLYEGNEGGDDLRGDG